MDYPMMPIDEDWVENYEDGQEVLAYDQELAQGEVPANDWSVDQIEHAYPVAPLLAASQAQMGDGPFMGAAMPVPPPAALQQPMNHQQQVVQQPTAVAQQPAVQQPGPGDRSCPVQGCNSLGGNTRLDHLWDHLAEVHGYERAANEYTMSETHLKRKIAAALKGLYTRDARKLAWNRACLEALEMAIRQRDSSYVTCHGLTLAIPHTIAEANASRKHQVITMLQHVRGAMGQKGRLYNQPGGAQGTSEEVYENLVATFQLNQNDQNTVIRQAEQHFSNLRFALDDDLSVQVSPADAARTHDFVLKQGASLPPK